jgi:lipoyl(octanoyl) transferase
MQVWTIDIGLSEYSEAWQLQKLFWDLRCKGMVPDALFLTEHKHTYTLGKAADWNHLLETEDQLKSDDISVFHIDRGGDITYHGPGQLVGYPIIDLNNYYLDIHRYLRDLEEVAMRTLSDYGITGQRVEGYTGVWVGDEKIVAIGIKVSRWVTMHGFAFNVNTDLGYFDKIIPCGIFHKGVTSLERLLHRKVDMEEVKRRVVEHFSNVFAVEAWTKSFEDLKKEIEITNN